MHDVPGEMRTFYRQIASKSKGGGWRAVGEKIGKSGAYARQIVNSQRPVTEEVAVAWMLSNGWHQRQIPVTPCPSCAALGIIRSHGDNLDCHNNDGEAIVLAPGETVRRPRAPWQSKARPEVAAMVRGLEIALERKQKISAP